jgi:hypothetical protein
MVILSEITRKMSFLILLSIWKKMTYSGEEMRQKRKERGQERKGTGERGEATEKMGTGWNSILGMRHRQASKELPNWMVACANHKERELSKEVISCPSFDK